MGARMITGETCRNGTATEVVVLEEISCTDKAGSSEVKVSTTKGLSSVTEITRVGGSGTISPEIAWGPQVMGPETLMKVMIVCVTISPKAGASIGLLKAKDQGTLILGTSRGTLTEGPRMRVMVESTEVDRLGRGKRWVVTGECKVRALGVL